MGENSNKPQKRKGWYISLVVLFTLVVALNGPIARSVITNFTNKALKSQGLNGYFFLKGTIVRGFTVKDLNYGGNQGIQQLQVNELKIDYRLVRELILQQKIRGLKVDGLTLAVAPNKFPEKHDEPEADPLDFQELQGILDLLRPWVTPCELSISSVNIQLIDNDETTLRLNFDQIHHAANSNAFHIVGYQVTMSEERETPLQDSTLSWLEDGFHLDRIELLPKLGVQALDLQLTPEFKTQGALIVSDALLNFKLNPEVIQLTLSQGTIHSEDITSLLDLESPATGQLDQFNAELTNWLQPPSSWTLKADVVLPNIESQGYAVENTHVTIEKVEADLRIDLTTTHLGAQLRTYQHIEFTDLTSPDWFQNFHLTSDNHLSTLQQAGSKHLPEALEIDLSETQIYLKAQALVSGLEVENATGNLMLSQAQISEIPLPDLTLTAELSADQTIRYHATAKALKNESLKTQGSIHLESFRYDADVQADIQDLEWLNTLAKNIELPVKLTKALKLRWNGSGVANSTDEHQGALEIDSLAFATDDYELPPVEISTGLEYAWPSSITLQHLAISDPDFSLKTQGSWDGSAATLTSSLIDKQSEPIAAFNATIPLRLDHLSIEKYFQQSDAIEVELKTQELEIPRLLRWLPQMEQPELKRLNGSVIADCKIQGSIKNPQVSGFVYLNQLTLDQSAVKTPIQVHLDFHSEDDQLFIDSKLSEQDKLRVSASLAFPYMPRIWANSNEDPLLILQRQELAGDLKIHTLPLQRLKEFLPQIEEIQGSLSGEAALSGTVENPQFTLNSKLRVPKIEISQVNVDHIRNLALDCNISSDRMIDAKLTALVNGSEFRVNASADINDLENPSFDVTADTDHALIFRDDKVSIRANAKLSIKGSLNDATLSGNVDLAESIFYQDIDILPIGVPSSAVATVKLPPVRHAELPLPIPEPFSNWKLDLKLGFADPLLIRGNIARGEISGTVKATGTLAMPKLDGKIATKDVLVKLPFSQLRLRKGDLVFDSSKRPILPTLDIRGASLVNKYQTELFIYGSPLDPKITLTSQPPLSQSDIVTLLATGITANDLKNNKEAATLRALQLFLAKFKQNADHKTSAKLIAALLSSIQDFEFNVNETDTFTGRKYSSARMKVHPKVFITAQVDEEKNTRGLVVFVLKFR